MITVADALEVMTIVTACHHRTAPRMDDEEVAFATAGIWRDLFEGYDFSTAELVAAVKFRAKTCPDAPEPADIIRVARTNRSDRMAREPLPQNTPDEEPTHYPGDAKAAPDPGEYPAEWDADQRCGAYWFALRLKAVPRTTAGWRAIDDQLREQLAKRSREGAA
jgi:hypothetical protein